MNPADIIPFERVAAESPNSTAEKMYCSLSRKSIPQKVRAQNKDSVYIADINTLAGLTQKRTAAV